MQSYVPSWNEYTMIKVIRYATVFISGKFYVLTWRDGRWVAEPLARTWELECHPVGIRVVGGIKLKK